MDCRLLLQGILLGFSIAAPVGPIGVLCIRRTLAEGHLSGLVSGLGAATADAIYGTIAACGLVFVVTPLIRQQAWLGAIGGAFLCFLGIRTLVSEPVQSTVDERRRGLLASYASALFLTLTNPMSILAFAAIIGSVGGAASAGNQTSAALLVLGVFIGSAIWWLVLSSAVSLFRQRFTLRALRWTNRLSGLLLLGFGLVSLVKLL